MIGKKRKQEKKEEIKNVTQKKAETQDVGRKKNMVLIKPTEGNEVWSNQRVPRL